jgi:Flp pilus assembly protein TadB
VNRSAKKQHHEQARKKHRHEQQEHAREAAKKKPSMLAFWILAIGLALVVAFVLVTAFF